MDFTDVTELARGLIRCPSVTPRDEGALDLLQEVLESLGFSVGRYKFGDTDNLHGCFGSGSPCLAFAGHTDVVPPGDVSAWSVDPFAAEVRDGVLTGRGAVDMKGAIASFLAALPGFLGGGNFRGSIVVLITGDEEASGSDGMVRLLPVLSEAGMELDHCLLGEPTSRQYLGDTLKHGRRGSLNGIVRAKGRQGHVAYPQEAANPLPKLVSFLHEIEGELDSGAPGFEPSNLEITSIEAVNPVSNIIPGQACARFNIRFNVNHDGRGLSGWLREQAGRFSDGGVSLQVEASIGSEAFMSELDGFSELVCKSVEAETGMVPELGTGGGTSDARHIRKYCPVLELGLRHIWAHQVDEQVPLSELQCLSNIYGRILRNYFT